MTGNSTEPRPITLHPSDATMGYCLQCLMAYKAGLLEGKLPALAITSAPVLVPITDQLGNAAGMIPVLAPACYDHLGAAGRRPTIYVAGSAS